MTKETAIKVCENLRDNYMSIIDKVLKNRLGIDVHMKCNIKENRFDNYIYLVPEDNTDVDNKMRGNKLLRHLFKSANLEISVWFDEDTMNFGFNVQVYYKHNDGGSNGHDLMVFYIDSKTKNVTYSKLNPKV